MPFGLDEIALTYTLKWYMESSSRGIYEIAVKCHYLHTKFSAIFQVLNFSIKINWSIQAPLPVVVISGALQTFSLFLVDEIDLSTYKNSSLAYFYFSFTLLSQCQAMGITFEK